MTEEMFWDLVKAAKAEKTQELFSQPKLLQQKLEQLPPEQIIGFSKIFGRLFHQAYTWDLWAAAYILGGGCSDDGFMDFRGGLIGLGRDAYYEALRDPETLAKQPTRGVDFFQEQMLYAADRAYEAVTGTRISDQSAHQAIPRPKEPAGEPWDEDRVMEKYPKLAERFGSY